MLGIWSSVHNNQGDSRRLDTSDGKINLADRVASYERSIIASEIKKHKGSIKHTYESLGVSRKALYEKMKKYQLDKNTLDDSV